MAAKKTVTPRKKAMVLKSPPYSGRRFLNLPKKDSNANVKILIQENAISKRDSYSMQIVISDCNSSVTLHGNMASAEDLENVLFKLTTLRDECDSAIHFIQHEFKGNTEIPV